MAIVALLFSAVAAAQPAPPDCPAEAARYTLTGQPSFTAGFARRPGSPGTAVFVRSAKSGATYWFALDQGNGVGNVHLIPVGGATEPPEERGPRLLGDEFFAFDPSLEVRSEAVRPADPAPRYLFMPGLPASLWYRSAELGGPGGGSRETMKQALFVLARCERS